MTRESAVAERHAPLRKLYRERPQEAVISKWAKTSTANVPASDPFHGEVEIGRGYGTFLRFGLDRQVGGLHDLPNPGDILCAALAACADGTVRMIADLLGVTLEDVEAEVSGEVDVRGALAIDPDVKVGFEALACHVRLRPASGADPRMVARLAEAAERFCVNLDTLRGGVCIDVSADLGVEDEPTSGARGPA